MSLADEFHKINLGTGEMRGYTYISSAEVLGEWCRRYAGEIEAGLKLFEEQVRKRGNPDAPK